MDRLKIVFFVICFLAPLYLANAQGLIDFQDDFSNNPNTNGKWQVYRYDNNSSFEAFWNSVEENWYLTKNSGSKAAAVFANYSLNTRKWKVEFDMKIGGGNSGDGMTFMFYKNKNMYGKPDAGGDLGFTVNGQSVTGYGIEFDTYRGDDPPTPHIALIKNNVTTHLTYNEISGFRDNNFHNIVINFDHGNILVMLDGVQVLDYSISNVNYNFSGVGFSAATGGNNDNHIIDNFKLYVNEIKIKYPDGGEIFAGNRPVDITWEVAPSVVSLINNVELFYSIDGGASFPYEITSSLSASDSSYSWLTPNLNSSSVKIKAIANNNNNNVLSEDESNGDFTIDSGPPNSFDLYLPINGEWTSKYPTFQWYPSSDDYSGLLKYQLLIGNICYIDSIPPYSTYYSLNDSLLPGLHVWTIKALDKAYNETQANQTWSIRVDTTRPTNFNLISPDNDEWSTTSRPNFIWQKSADTESGLAKYQLYIDNTLFVNNISSNSASVVPNSNIVDGEHQWHIVAIDNVNNIRQSTEKRTIRIDTSPPGGSFKNGLKGSYYSSPGSGNEPVFGDLKCTRLDEEINFDWQENSPASGVSANDFQVIWTGEVFAPSTGTYTFKTYTDDGVKLWIENHLLINQWHDQEPTYYSATKYLNGNQWYRIIMYYYENEVDATAKLYWKPPDSSEEIIPSNSLRCEVGFDLLLPDNNLWLKNETPTFYWEKAVDYGIGLSKYQLWIDNELKIDNISTLADSVVLDTSLALSHGSHTWFIKAFDKLDNASNSNSTRTIKVDNRPPSSFSLKLPSDSSFVSFPTPDFSWNSSYDSDSKLSHYQVWIDDALSADNIKSTSSAPGSPLIEGYHNWCVKAIDNVGNEQKSDETWIIVGEWNPPLSFDLTIPKDGDTVKTSQPVFAWYSSNDLGAGLKKYQLWIDGQLEKDNISPIDTSASPTNSLLNGMHNWFVKAIDKANNETVSTSIRQFVVNRDLTPPVSNITNLADGDIIGGDRFLIKGISDDGQGSGVDSVLITLDGGTTWYNTINTGVNFSTWEYSWTDLSHGSHILKSLARDFEGNLEIPDSETTVYVNKNAPYVSNFNVEPNPATIGIVTVTLNFSANTSGINNIIKPIVEYLPVNDSTSFIFTETSFINDTWQGTATIDSSIINGTAFISVRGATDNLGNVMIPNNNVCEFIIDTVAPTISDIFVTPNPAKAGNIDVSVNFYEATSSLNTLISPTVLFTPLGGLPVSITQISYDDNENKWNGTAIVTQEMNDGIATIQIKDASDIAGNIMPINDNAGSF